MAPADGDQDDDKHEDSSCMDAQAETYPVELRKALASTGESKASNHPSSHIDT